MSTDTHATPGATDAEADATEGRVYNVSGGDWDEIVTEDTSAASTSRSSSTWARSTRPRTACSG